MRPDARAPYGTSQRPGLVAVAIALALIPDFGLILLGLVIRRWLLRDLDEGFWVGLEKLVYFILFPALLFNALTRIELQMDRAGPLVLAGLLSMATGMLLALPVARLFPISPVCFASQFQCAFRFNSYIGMAVAGKLHGAAGLAAMGLLAGAMVPFANLAAVWMLARHGGSRLLRELARNPLVLATLAGFTWNLLDWGVPLPARHFLGRLSDAAIALGLISVGAALRLRGAIQPGGRGAAAWILVVKLLAMPLAAVGLAQGLEVQGLNRQILLEFAALPTAGSAYILAQRMGGDGTGVAWLVSASTLIAMLTLPAWLGLAQ